MPNEGEVFRKLAVNPLMRKMRIILLILFVATNMVAQDWSVQIANQSKLIGKIIQNEDWNSILNYAKKELKLPSELLYDISKTIEFQTSHKDSNLIDQFFHIICDSTYTEFPYRKSGHLTDDLYTKPTINTSEIYQFLNNINGLNLYPKFAEIINIKEETLIPKLIEYLKIDAATRLCVKPMNWNEAPFYLSISDVALELLEVKTYCDFFDNASHSQKLFSNTNKNEKDKLLSEIDQWYKQTKSLSKSEKVEYFLDSICPMEYKYKFTCHNLLYIGDTMLAKKMYNKFYNQMSMPCIKDWEVGEILLSIGDSKVIEDCMNTAMNYRCMDESGKKCVEILLNSEFAYYRDNFLAEIISTEPHSQYRKSGSGPGYIWHKIFGDLADFKKYKLPKTLIELLKIKDEFNSISEYYTYKWNANYSKEIQNKFRICDFALLKYDETIEKIGALNWEDIEERNKMINLIINKYKN